MILPKYDRRTLRQPRPSVRQSGCTSIRVGGAANQNEAAFRSIIQLDTALWFRLNWPKHTCHKKRKPASSSQMMESYGRNEFILCLCNMRKGKSGIARWGLLKVIHCSLAARFSVPSSSSSQLRKRIKRNTDTAPFASGREAEREGSTRRRKEHVHMTSTKCYNLLIPLSAFKMYPDSQLNLH